ncbi:MAG: HD domain-containing protein [Clostridia bacterium]|nr:HD domain-containing protein [Clostridia bacterium]
MAMFFASMVSGSFSAANTAMAASGKQATVDPSGKGEGYSAALYDNTNGLTTSEANAIVETRDGFIWIGSYSGLTRYDGRSFERIDSTTGIASVVSLFVDSKERLWIGTNDNGVAMMEKDNLVFYNHQSGLKSSSVRSIAEDTDGTVFIGTTEGIAKIDSENQLRQFDDERINKEYIRTMLMGNDGVIYGVTNDGAIFTLKDGALSGFYDADSLGIPEIRTILPDPDNAGKAYVGTAQSDVYCLDFSGEPQIVKTVDVSPLNYVNSISAIDDHLWVCADNGISIVSGDKSTRLLNLPVNGSVEGVIADYQGNIWAASSKQGVMKIVSNPFSELFEKYGMSETVVNATCQYEGLIFVGGKSSGLSVIGELGPIDRLPLTKVVTASGREIGGSDLIDMLRGSRIRSIVRDSRNRLWISTFGENALLRYEDGAVTRFSTDDGLPSDRVRTVIEMKDGKIAVACTGGVAVIDGDTVTDVYGESSGIANAEILTIAEGLWGDIIAGTDGGGIYVIRDGSAAHIGLDSGLFSEVVMRIKKDLKRNLYWVVTSNSIAYLDENYQATTVKKFPYSNNFDLYQNSQDQLWILSSNGIYVVSSDEMVQNEEINPVHYSRDNGLFDIPTANAYSDLTSDGDLYIAGTTGVSKVNIEKSFEVISNVKLAVPCVEADGTRIFFDENNRVTVPASTRKLTIYSYAFNYSLVNPEITYRLDGFDAKETTVERSDLAPIDYTNLSGGKYQFNISLGDSLKEDEALTFYIVKQKAMYEETWFRLVCAGMGLLFLLIVVMAYTRSKTRKFLQKEKEQKLLIREIVEAFSKVIDMKDKYTNGHSARVAEYTVMLAKELGYDDDTVDEFYNIALLHDIGKVGIPPEVLNKPGKLTDEEFKTIKSHAALGYDTLKGISIMPELAIGAGSHHERPDGRGYPKGLKGDEIPRVAQIIAVADTFDAMYSNRPYRKRMNFEKAVSIIKEVRGTQLQSDVVDAFLRLVDKGKFRAPDDFGGGTTEDINNIHKKQKEEEKNEQGK